MKIFLIKNLYHAHNKTLVCAICWKSNFLEKKNLSHSSKFKSNQDNTERTKIEIREKPSRKAKIT